MKIKKLLFFIGCLLIVKPVIFSQNAPIVTIASIAACSGDTVSLDVTVENFDSIIAFNLRLDYDSTKLKFVNITNWNPLIVGALENDVPASGCTKKIMIAWLDALLVPRTLPNNSVLFTLNFVNNLYSGSTIVAFNNAADVGHQCEYADAGANPLNDSPTSTYYINGTVSHQSPPKKPGVINGDDFVCLNSTGNVYSIQAVPGATGYLWTVPNSWNITSGQGSASITVSTDSTAGEISVQATNACGNSSKRSKSISFSSVLSQPGFISGDSIVNSGTACKVYSISAVPDATYYTWSVPQDWTITSGDSATSITVITGIMSGDITVKAANPCFESIPQTKFITVQPSPPLLVDTVCAGSTTFYSVINTGDSTCQWVVSGVGNSIISNDSLIQINWSPVSGIDTLRVIETDQFGCVSSYDYAIISRIPLPAVDAGSNGATCMGSNYTVSAATASDYSTLNWYTSGNGSFVNSGTISPTYIPGSADIASGTVKLFLEAAGNAPCGDALDSMILTIAPLPLASAGVDDTICEGNTFTISNASFLNSSHIHWSTLGSGLFSSANIINPVYTPSVADIANGSVRLVLTAFGNGPCSSIDTTVLAIIPLPAVNAGQNDTICEGEVFTITKAAEANNYSSLQWTTSGTGTLIDADTLTPTYTPSAADIANGSVTLTLTVQGNAPCTGNIKDSMNLIIRSKPLTSQLQELDTLCVTSTTGHYSINGTNGSTFLWEVINGTIISPNGNDSVTILWNQAAGIYELRVVETSRYGCVGDTIIEYVVIEEVPEFSIIGPDTICEGETVELLATGQYDYVWNIGQTGPYLIDKPLATITYAVIGTTKCGADTAYHEVTVIPLPNTKFYFVPSMPYTNEKVEFIYNGEINRYNYYQWWLNGNIFISQSNTGSYIFTKEGRQKMQLIVVNSFGCSDTTIKTINISKKHTFWVPSAFTPNNDGINDLFFVKGYDIYKFRMQIYNRWGNLVFESNDIHRGWDGKSESTDCPPGVYNYVIYYEGEANVAQEREGYESGQVILIR